MARLEGGEAVVTVGDTGESFPVASWRVEARPRLSNLEPQLQMLAQATANFTVSVKLSAKAFKRLGRVMFMDDRAWRRHHHYHKRPHPHRPRRRNKHGRVGVRRA